MSLSRRQFLKNLIALGIGLYFGNSLVPELSAGNTAEIKQCKIAFFGDTLLGGYYNSKFGTSTKLIDKINLLYNLGGIEYVSNELFKGVDKIIVQSDYRILNLEGPISKKEDLKTIINNMYKKEIPLRQHEICAEILKCKNIDLVSLVNNHMFDYNLGEGLKTTISELDKFKINYVGVGLCDLAYIPLIKEINGIKFGILGVSDVLEPINMYAKDNFYGITGIPEMSNYKLSENLNKIISNFKSIRDEIDFSIIMLHAGPVAGYNLNKRQIEISDILLNSGIDVIIGHHSYSKQPIKEVVHQNKLNQIVFYGIGNFIFGGRNGLQSRSYIPLINFEKNYLVKRLSYIIYEIDPNPNFSFCPEIINLKNRFLII